MPGRRSAYNEMTNAEIKTNLLMTLDEATPADMPTTTWLKDNNIVLSKFSPQKLSRSLNELCDMGLVKKGRSNKLNKMVYRLTSKI